MNRLKQIIAIALIATTATLLMSSSVQTGEKQILTLEIKEDGVKDAIGIYVYQQGKNIDFVELESYKPKKETIIKNGEKINSTINKYYKENWRLISTTSPGGTAAFTRLVFEK